MKRAIRILARGAAPMALAMGVVGALSTPALAAPASAEAPAALSTAAFSSPLPTWGYNDNRHHTNRDHCRRFGGHDMFDRNRHHFYCHGGRDDQDWF
jgi:hypothetical protein